MTVPHTDLLAMAPYSVLVIAAAATAVLFTVAVMLRLRRAHMLVGAATMLLLAFWFGLLAITSGPAPLLRRGEIADVLRWLALAIAAVWFGWLALYARSLVRVERRRSE